MFFAKVRRGTADPDNSKAPRAQTQRRRLSDQEVALAYQLFLGREPSREEVALMTAEGRDLGRIRNVFLSSEEFRQRLAADLGVEIVTPRHENPLPGHVSCISWPRSGHHLLVELLRRYFGAGFHYCEFYNDRPDHPDIASCCRVVPCAHTEKITLSKNHDLDLDFPQIPGRRYLIQHRAFLPATVSNYELHVRAGGRDSRRAFWKFALAEWKRYERFAQKWLLSDFARAQTRIAYEDLVAAPETQLARAVLAIAPDARICRKRISDAVRHVAARRLDKGEIVHESCAGVAARRDVRSFRYYDKELFTKFAQREAELMSGLE